MVTARSDAFGLSNFSENCVETTYVEYWKENTPPSTSQRGWVQGNHQCERKQPSKNWHRQVPGTNIMFMTPSSYDRGIRDVKFSSGVWEKFSPPGVSVKYQSKEGPPDTKVSFSMFAVAPIQTGNFCNIDSNLNNQVKTEALLKMKGKNALQLGADALEAKKTVNMLGRAGNTLAEALNAYKRKQYQRIPRIFGDHFGGDMKTPTKGFANGFLEYNYGWKPLMQTIYDGHKLFKEQVTRGVLLSVSRTVTDHQSFQKKVIVPGWESSGHATRSHSCKLWFSITDPALYRANQLGLINPASMVWEAMRYSFVIDWLVPVGDFLDAITAHMGTTFVGGYTGQRMIGSSYARQLPPAGWDEASPRDGNMEFMSLRRQRLTAFPRPAPFVKSPFSTSHALSAAALIRQLGRK